MQLSVRIAYVTHTEIYALLAGLLESKSINILKVVVFIDSWLLTQFLNNTMTIPPQEASIIQECIQILRVIDSQIIWYPNQSIQLNSR